MPPSPPSKPFPAASTFRNQTQRGSHLFLPPGGAADLRISGVFPIHTFAHLHPSCFFTLLPNRSSTDLTFPSIMFSCPLRVSILITQYTRSQSTASAAWHCPITCITVANSPS